MRPLKLLQSMVKQSLQYLSEECFITVSSTSSSTEHRRSCPKTSCAIWQVLLLKQQQHMALGRGADAATGLDALRLSSPDEYENEVPAAGGGCHL